MKKTILLTGILLFSVSFTFAQFAEKGSMLFNGSISYYTGKFKAESGGSVTSEGTSTHWSVSPMFQYFVINNLSVGALLDASSSVDDIDGFGKITQTDLIFAPVLRYYIWEALFAQAYYGFGSGVNKFESGQSGTSESKVKVSQWAIVAGYSVRITDTVLFDPMIGYRMETRTDDADSESKNKYGQVCIQLGFTILINK